MKNFRNIITILLIVLLVVLKLTINTTNNYINDDMVVNYDIDSILYDQEIIDSKIKSISNNKKYTFDNPYIYNNPYEISPLTSLIIFKTDNEESINVNINDEYIYDSDISTTHLLKIYGLISNYDNIITLTTKDGKTNTIHIKTEDTDINTLDVSINKLEKNDDLYFMTSPVGTPCSAYDSSGKLKWYLTLKFTMDFEWLDNGHFLVGIDNASVADRKIGFVEMDYFGKIYNYYVLKNGYEFEFQTLSNGNIMLCGGNSPVFYTHPLIYEMDASGNVVSSIDLYEIIKSVDSDFPDSKLNFKIIRNAFSYNEDNDELIVSLRGLNTVMSINYKTKKINYIFAPEGIYSDKFDKYMVTLESGRYPLGEHSVIITEDGYIGFINNGYDRFNGFEVGGIDLVSHYDGDYTSAEIYEIKDMKANLVWSYDGDEKYFSHQYGSFNINDGYKLVNFGWTLHDFYRNKDTSTLSLSEKSTMYTYAKIVEFDTDNNIVFSSTIEDGKYRVFKHSIYDNTDDFDIVHYNFYNTFDKSEVEVLSNSDIKDKLDSASLFSSDVSFTSYSLDTSYTFDNYDEVYILLVGINNSYKVLYKEEGSTVKKDIYIDLNNGEYALYLVINDTYYSTNRKVIYK